MYKLIEAKKNGADYLGVGAMFTTNTKLDAKSVSMNTLKDIKANINLPIVGIGGINLNNVEKLKACNIDGYAIVSAILGAQDIYEETKKWINIL